MLLKDIQKTLNAEILTGEKFLDRKVSSAFSSDLMSDVLAFAEENSLLITGLNNAQTIRTAEMLDLVAIVIVRNKTPQNDLVDLANSKDIVLMTTEHTLFTSSGLLYDKGLRGVTIHGA